MAKSHEDTLDLEFNIDGLGYTAIVKYSHAVQYWTDNSIPLDDNQAKADRVRVEFIDDGATDEGWRKKTFGEASNKAAGSIGVSVGLLGQSGVTHDYTIEFSTNWIDLPDKTASFNGAIFGFGELPEERITSAVDYYKNYDFDTTMSGSVPESGWESGETYLQSESLSIDYKTGDISYNRGYTNHELPYKDTWTIENSIADGEEDGVTVSGTIVGLRTKKEERYAAVYSAFTTIFATDENVWDSKVATVMGASTPDQGYVKTRSISYNDVAGTIGYSYAWGIAPSSGEIDYSMDGSYDREADEWTFNCTGEVRGSGTSPATKRESAMIILPHEDAAWDYTYANFVSKLHINSKTLDVPRIADSSGTILPDTRYLTSRNFGTDQKTGAVTFSYSWSSNGADYKDVSIHEHSWDDISATETINVNGTIKGDDDSKLEAGWIAIYNGGDPACPTSVYAARHSTEFADSTPQVVDTLPASSPISGSPKMETLVFGRKATMISSSYGKKQDGNTNQLTYSFVFAYKAWPYGLPLWFKDLSVTFNVKKSVDVWAQNAIIGKRTGPVHQDMNARGPSAFDVSISINVGKRKADQFGSYISTLLSEYSEYILRQVFLDRSGYDSFNYSRDNSNQNCYLTNDSIDIDVINGTLGRSVSIMMLNIQD